MKICKNHLITIPAQSIGAPRQQADSSISSSALSRQENPPQPAVAAILDKQHDPYSQHSFNATSRVEEVPNDEWENEYPRQAEKQSAHAYQSTQQPTFPRVQSDPFPVPPIMQPEPAPRQFKSKNPFLQMMSDPQLQQTSGQDHPSSFRSQREGSPSDAMEE